MRELRNVAERFAPGPPAFKAAPAAAASKVFTEAVEAFERNLLNVMPCNAAAGNPDPASQELTTLFDKVKKYVGVTEDLFSKAALAPQSGADPGGAGQDQELLHRRLASLLR